MISIINKLGKVCAHTNGQPICSIRYQHRLSFVEREPHCLWHVVLKSLVIYSMIGSRPTLMDGMDSLSHVNIPLCLLHWNCSEMRANWAPVQQDGRTTSGALSGCRAPLVCIHFLMMWTPFHIEWASQIRLGPAEPSTDWRWPLLVINA